MGPDIGSGGRTIDKTIDSSGLSGGGTSGDILSETHSLNANTTGAYWLSANNALANNQVLEFTIPKSDINAVHQWIYTRVDNHDRAIKTFDISFSTDDGVTFPTTIPAATLGDFTIGNGTVQTAQTKTFALQTGVTNVRFTNIQNFGNSSVGLSEIRFGGPGTGPAMALGDPDVTVLSYDQAEATSFLSGEDASAVTLYWGTVDQGESQTGWDASASLGAQTAGAAIPVPAALMASLTQGTTYHCRFHAQSASSAATAWSNAASFSTPNALLLTNPQTNYVAYDEADVTVTSNRDTDTTRLYWGTTDPGATATGWDHGPVSLGAQTAGTIPAETLSGLTELTQYFFRFVAISNSPVASTAWSAAGTFSTPFENPPTIITPSAVTATNSLASYPIANTINSSGLDSSAPSVLDWTHVATPGNSNNFSWLGTKADTEIIYELPGTSTLDYLFFWSCWGGTDSRSLTAFDISFSSNGVDYSTPTTITLGTPGSATEIFALGGADERHARQVRQPAERWRQPGGHRRGAHRREYRHSGRPLWHLGGRPVVRYPER